MLLVRTIYIVILVFGTWAFLGWSIVGLLCDTSQPPRPIAEQSTTLAVSPLPLAGRPCPFCLISHGMVMAEIQESGWTTLRYHCPRCDNVWERSYPDKRISGAAGANGDAPGH
jgi:hypothetical protein